MTTARVLMADDHPLLVHGLADLVSRAPDFIVVEALTSGRAAIERIRALEPDIAILDVSMPDMTGLAILRKVSEECLPVRVVFLTATMTAAQISEALAYGAWGLLLKETATDRLIECLRTVMQGRRWLPAELLAQADPDWADSARDPVDNRLTKRQREIVKLVCAGISNRDIAAQLGSAEGTVKIHLHTIFQKLGVTNRTALAALHFKMQGMELK